MDILDGMKLVRQFFPEAKLGVDPSDRVVKAVREVARLDDPGIREILATFDKYGVSVPAEGALRS